jgi:hypothetical protein
MSSNDLAARLMGDMAPQLLEFLKTKVNSFVKWDLVRFFHENPNTTDTAENIARYAGRDVATIEIRPCARSWISLSWPAMTGNSASRPFITSFGECAKN